GAAPLKKLFTLGQRILSPARQVDLIPQEIPTTPAATMLPREKSFVRVEGDAVVTSIQREGDALLVRLFNPTTKATKTTIISSIKAASAKSVTLDGKGDSQTSVRVADANV